MTNQIITRAEAKAQGLKRYYTGVPCVHGHITERQTTNGTCIPCSRKMAKPAAAIWRKKNKKHRTDKARERCREKVKNDPDWVRRKANYMKEWRSRPENKLREKVTARDNKKKHRARYTAQENNRRAKKLGNGGEHTAEQIANLMIKQRGNCAWCFKPLGEKWHRDHVMPIALGGSNDITNIQILHVTCNVRKNKKDPFQFARENGRLL